MIEREFIQQKTKEFYIKKEIQSTLKGAGVSQIRLKKIPLGEKIIVHTSRPSLIVGSKGSNIKDLTRKLKKDFKLENPQIEIVEVKNIFLDANIVAERIVSSLERFGSARFKGVGHKVMENVLNSGALGIELIISGKIPGSRAKSWRFYQGYLKKCGDVAVSGVSKARKSALLKSGIVGIKVAIMPPDLELPDTIKLLDEPITIVEEIKTAENEIAEPKKKVARKKVTKKRIEKVVEEEKPEVENEKVQEAVTEAKSKPVETTKEVVEKGTKIKVSKESVKEEEKLRLAENTKEQ
jgi:small subunit ribosomal protein S3